MERYLSREEAIREHRKLWNWIADTTERENRVVHKKEYFTTFGSGKDKVFDDCFCCEYSKCKSISTGDYYMCKHCPLIWFEGQRKVKIQYKAYCTHRDSPYLAFLRSKNVKDRAKAAREIANLKEM